MVDRVGNYGCDGQEKNRSTHLTISGVQQQDDEGAQHCRKKSWERREDCEKPYEN